MLVLNWALTFSVLQAVAGADHNISLISIVEARVVSLFKGDAKHIGSCVWGHEHPQALPPASINTCKLRQLQVSICLTSQ